MNQEELITKITELAALYLPKLALAIVTLLIGLWIIRMVTTGFERAMKSSNTDATLQRFLSSLFNIVLKALLLISVASMVGIETTSFIAVLGAAGLAIGLALQGSLSNFAGGVLILLFRPYRVGDVVEVAGATGAVKSIEIFNTVLTTPDNKRVIVPNGAAANGVLTNYSAEETRRVDIVFGVGYDADLRQAKEILTRMITSNEKVLSDPEPMIVISALGDNAVDITTRSWVNSADYWGVFFELMEGGKLALDDAGINIPYPQRDVHLYKHED